MIKIIFKRCRLISFGYLGTLGAISAIEPEERPYGRFGSSSAINIQASQQRFAQLNNPSSTSPNTNTKMQRTYLGYPIEDSTSSSDEQDKGKSPAKRNSMPCHSPKLESMAYNSPSATLYQKNSESDSDGEYGERIVEKVMEMERPMREGFLKFFQEEVGAKINLNTVSAYDYIQDIESRIRDHFQYYEKDLKNMFGTIESPIHTIPENEPINPNLEDLTSISKEFSGRIANISSSFHRLGTFKPNQMIEPYGMIHYTKGLFNLFHKYCKPLKKTDNHGRDDMNVWRKKQNVIIMNFATYISHFEKRTELLKRIKQEAAYILIDFYKESCEYIQEYYGDRFIANKLLTGKNWRNATTADLFHEFSKNFRISFCFLYPEDTKSKRKLEKYERETLVSIQATDKRVAELSNTDLMKELTSESFARVTSRLPESVTTGVSTAVSSSLAGVSNWVSWGMGTTTAQPTRTLTDPKADPKSEVKKGWW